MIPIACFRSLADVSSSRERRERRERSRFSCSRRRRCFKKTRKNFRLRSLSSRPILSLNFDARGSLRSLFHIAREEKMGRKEHRGRRKRARRMTKHRRELIDRVDFQTTFFFLSLNLFSSLSLPPNNQPKNSPPSPSRSSPTTPSPVRSSASAWDSSGP